MERGRGIKGDTHVSIGNKKTKTMYWTNVSHLKRALEKSLNSLASLTIPSLTITAESTIGREKTVRSCTHTRVDIRVLLNSVCSNLHSGRF